MEGKRKSGEVKIEKCYHFFGGGLFSLKRKGKDDNQCLPGPGVCPGGAPRPGQNSGPAPGGAAAPASFTGAPAGPPPRLTLQAPPGAGPRPGRPGTIPHKYFSQPTKFLKL